MQTREIDFSKYSSLKIGGVLEVKVLQSPLEEFDGFLIGGANNLLVSPKAKNLYILGKEFEYIKDLGEVIEIGGAMSSGRIYSYFKARNLWGLEFLRGLPGSMGGLVKMNAGMKSYEIAESIHSVLINGKWVDREEIPFTYRRSGIEGVIYAVRVHKKEGFREDLVEVFKQMRSTHPHLPSCGSCFKNPEGDFAGRLLESVGLRGYRVGGVGFSEKHANFLVNYGGGRFEEAKELIALGKKKVQEASGVKLECEVVIIE